MTAADLPAACAISDAVHGGYTERPEVYEERLRLFPAGCRVLESDGAVVGYLVSHPWRSGGSPELDRTVGALPADADVFYLHDLALLPSVRGTGAGAAGLAEALRIAAGHGFGAVELTAVSGADAWWAARGFVDAGPAQGGGYGPEARRMRRAVG